MKTIIIKTELEQFQEQYPELYQQVFDLGYNSYLEQQELYADPTNPYYNDDHYGPCLPTDDTKRYYAKEPWNIIYKMAEGFEEDGYKAGNRDWREFMNNYKDYNFMYIAFNPQHKLFAVESDMGTIDHLYPKLVNGECVAGYQN